MLGKCGGGTKKKYSTNDAFSIVREEFSGKEQYVRFR